ncbi:MAG: hypothetical protein EXR60_06465 [Dehalococcoidia bacterium]|nr:hypothetical protein [Dehalococcoidia bacterium]
MRNTILITAKEFRSYFTSPIAYVVTAVFLALTGFFFAVSVTRPLADASMRDFVSISQFILWFIIPALTMRLFAEEQKLGTLEMLLTAPVRDIEVVLGKYLASLGVLLAMLLPTAYFVALLFWFGTPDTGPILSAYIGLVLMGAALLTLGLFASSLSSNQIIAFVVGAGIILVLLFADAVAGLPGADPPLFVQRLVAVIQYASIRTHLIDFSRGVIDTRDVIYYAVLTVVGLFLTVRSLETRRWR